LTVTVQLAFKLEMALKSFTPHTPVRPSSMAIAAPAASIIKMQQDSMLLLLVLLALCAE
jgi:hypothetical protein